MLDIALGNVTRRTTVDADASIPASDGACTEGATAIDLAIVGTFGAATDSIADDVGTASETRSNPYGSIVGDAWVSDCGGSATRPDRNKRWARN